ncbi:MAG: hypothetical protein JXR91_13785 [Deltaproteobacteria bacterium]|nr:hypothetical protein [Deltaproteobacteria bacterium]
MFKKIFLMLLFISVCSTIGCSTSQSDDSDTDQGVDSDTGETFDSDSNAVSDSDSDSDEIMYSKVFPYGIFYQLFSNSPSVNTAPHSSYLMMPIGNTTKNPVTVPDIPTADSFSNTLYFDSNAPDGGDGTMDSPYNSLDIITEENYPDDCAVLLKADSVFYSSTLKAGADKTDVYFGSYGKGAMPVVTNVDDLKSPGDFAMGSQFTGANITVDGIHLIEGSDSTYGVVLGIGGTNLTIANSHIESINTPGSGYLFNIMKGGGENMVLYHNEIAYSRDDIWYASSNGTYQIVSNYFHHANMGVYKADNFDPENRDTWSTAGGDIIQFEYPGLTDTYIANNFFDKGDSACKFGLIFNGGHDNTNVVIEYNTIIAPMNFGGGAAIQLHADAVVKNNLLMNTDPEGGTSVLASYPEFAADITNNHIVGYQKDTAFWNLTFEDLGEDNLIFDNLDAYQSKVLPADRLGSDIF